MSKEFSLEQYGIQVKRIFRNAAPARLYEEGLRNEEGTAISSTGALMAYSGKKTGRSPTDKRIVFNEGSESAKDIWWGKVNIKLEEYAFKINRERALDYLNTKNQLFVVDGYAVWEPKYRLKSLGVG